MKLTVKIKHKLVEISLLKNHKTVDRLTFPENHNLSEKLLPAINSLLKKNKLRPQDIKEFVTQTDAPESFTTSRIAKIVEKTWAFFANVNKERS